METNILTSMEISVITFKDEGSIFAYCPSLNLISYGDTEEDAKESFRFIFDEYIQYTTENNTLIEDLLKTGGNSIVLQTHKNPVPMPTVKSILITLEATADSYIEFLKS